eukprot:scaffold1769_cov185-Amphora_coffeaeformis.AAC.3
MFKPRAWAVASARNLCRMPLPYLIYIINNIPRGCHQSHLYPKRRPIFKTVKMMTYSRFISVPDPSC